MPGQAGFSGTAWDCPLLETVPAAWSRTLLGRATRQGVARMCVGLLEQRASADERVAQEYQYYSQKQQ